ncbi:MAG TPA: ribosome maturation factor RimM [Steroidobacter sp.]
MSDEAAGLERRVVLGRIRGAFGVKGWVKVESYTDPPANILKYPTWQVGRAGAWEALELQAGRVTGKGVLAKLASIETPEDARLRIGAEVAVLRSELPPTAPGEFYWSDLEGLEAVSASGAPLGRVDHFRSMPAGTVIVVTGEREHWVPFVKERIVKVELDAGRIVLDWEPDW